MYQLYQTWCKLWIYRLLGWQYWKLRYREHCSQFCWAILLSACDSLCIANSWSQQLLTISYLNSGAGHIPGPIIPLAEGRHHCLWPSWHNKNLPINVEPRTLNDKEQAPTVILDIQTILLEGVSAFSTQHKIIESSTAEETSSNLGKRFLLALCQLPCQASALKIKEKPTTEVDSAAGKAQYLGAHLSRLYISAYSTTSPSDTELWFLNKGGHFSEQAGSSNGQLVTIASPYRHCDSLVRDFARITPRQPLPTQRKTELHLEVQLKY